MRDGRAALATLIPAALLGAIAFASVLIVTDPPGPGLDPDALSYMGAAEWVAGHGEIRVPTAKWTSADSTEALAHFPPAYPVVLALPVYLGMSPPQAARLVQATSAFVTVTVLVLLVGAATSERTGVLLTFALFAMTSMARVHASVLSEPFYLMCTVLTLSAMVLSPTHPLDAGIAAAIGAMTRYAGASLVGAAALWALARPGTWRDRLRRAALAAFPAFILGGMWVLRTRTVTGSGEIRQFAFYGNLWPSLEQGGATLAEWLIPAADADQDPVPYRAVLALAAGLSLLVLVCIGVRRMHCSSRADARAHASRRLVRATGLLLACYAGLVGASRLVADPGIPFDERILAPALLLLMLLAAVGLAWWWNGARLRTARIVVGVAVASWVVAAASSTWTTVHYMLEWGSDLAGDPWRESEMLRWARDGAARKPLYSNWPPAVWFHLHRPARELPRERDAQTLAQFADTVRARGGRVLLFSVQDPEFAPNEQLVRQSGLRVVARLADGLVLGP